MELLPQNYTDTPITLEINPLTGYRFGEDGPNPALGNPGYRGMRTQIAPNREPLVIPAGLEQRSVFDGKSLYGVAEDPTVYTLPGGLRDGALFMRELPARTLDRAAQTISEITDGEMRLFIVDGLETHMRQSAGFTKTLVEVMAQAGVTVPTLTELHTLGKKAEGTYAYVKADIKSDEYVMLAAELLMNPETAQEINAIAETISESTGLNKLQAQEKVLFELITISANSNIGPAKDREIPLDFEHNAHAGGGAADVFITDKQGRVLSLVPYCWVGPEAAMDFSENDANFESYKATWARDPGLQMHMKLAGFPSVDAFTMHDWEIFKMANRVRYHALVSLGCTFYSAHNPEEGGENWHFEPDGVVLYDCNGTIIDRSHYLARNTQPGRGNPGHTLQKVGPRGVAVYGGRSGHYQAERQRILAA